MSATLWRLCCNAQVQKIMTRNIEEVLTVGEKLDLVTKKSSELAQESRK